MDSKLVLIFSSSFTGCRVISNALIFDDIKVAEHVWDPPCHLTAKTGSWFILIEPKTVQTFIILWFFNWFYQTKFTKISILHLHIFNQFTYLIIFNDAKYIYYYELNYSIWIAYVYIFFTKFHLIIVTFRTVPTCDHG